MSGVREVERQARGLSPVDRDRQSPVLEVLRAGALEGELMLSGRQRDRAGGPPVGLAAVDDDLGAGGVGLEIERAGFDDRARIVGKITLFSPFDLKRAYLPADANRVVWCM